MFEGLHQKPNGIARHPSTIGVLKHFFIFADPARVRGGVVVELFGLLAQRMANDLPEGPDLTVALRQLLDARDGFLRTLVE